MVILPGTGNIARQAVTGGIKNRLGKLGKIFIYFGFIYEFVGTSRNINISIIMSTIKSSINLLRTFYKVSHNMMIFII